MNSYSAIGRNRQQGAVLVIAMLILIVMTLIGVSSMNSSLLEERMARNARDMNTALQAAEAALVDAETYLDQPVIDTFGNAEGLYTEEYKWDSRGDYGSLELYEDQPWSWWIDDTKTEGYSEALAGVALQPRYYIEEIGIVTEPGKSLVIGFSANAEQSTYYRITAWGGGFYRADNASEPESVAILQTTYKR
jgi:type IV pilus assembly protein PilX